MIERLNKLFKSDKNYSILAILIIFMMTCAMMFFYTPFCSGGDFYVHFNRFVILMEALQDGSFPVYMDYYMVDGYGYLIKAFYSDFLLIPFAVIGNLTDPIFAYQSMIFTLTLLCGIFTYIAAKKVLKCKYAALITALLFTFATYRVFDIYIRAALGEVFSFTFLPLVLWGAYEIVKGNYKRWYILSIAFSLLIFSHVISTVLTAFTLAIFLLIYYKSFKEEPKRLYYLVLSALVCIPITAYYIFPMMEQMLSNSFYYQTNKLVDGVMGYRLNEVISGLFNSVALRHEKIFPKLGSILTFIVLLRIFVKGKSKELRFADISVIVGVIFIFMTTPQFPWHIFPFSLLGVIQFSWRLLEYISFFFALAGGYYLSRLLLNNGKQKIIATLTIIIIHLLVFNSDSIHYRTYICNTGQKGKNIKINTTFRGIIGGEYLPSRLPANEFVYDMPDVFNDFIHFRGIVVKPQNETTQISNLYKNRGYVSLDAIVTENDKLELPLTYYKGYKATLDNEPVEIQQSQYGLIELPINKSGNIIVEYVGTTLQKICLYVTLISILLLIVYIVYGNRKEKNGAKNIS